MLARLDEGLAPARAAVNREGTLLRIDGLDTNATGAVVESTVSLVSEMSYVAEPISDPVDVIRWYEAAEVDELSAEEARVLTERWIEELLREGLIRETDRKAAHKSIHSILSVIFAEAAETGVLRTDRIDAPAEPPEGVSKEVFDLVRKWLLRKLALST